MDPYSLSEYDWLLPTNVKSKIFILNQTPLGMNEQQSLLSPFWLNQVHGNCCIQLPQQAAEKIGADASFTQTPNVICAVRTADCVPILFTNQEGNLVGVIHAGWRGTLAGIIEKTFNKLPVAPQNLSLWIGPAICSKCYQVREDLYHLFLLRTIILLPPSPVTLLVTTITLI